MARCRVREHCAGVQVTVEVGADDRHLVTTPVLDRVATAMRHVEPTLTEVRLDDRPYRPGRAFTVLA